MASTRSYLDALQKVERVLATPPRPGVQPVRDRTPHTAREQEEEEQRQADTAVQQVRAMPILEKIRIVHFTTHKTQQHRVLVGNQQPTELYNHQHGPSETRAQHANARLRSVAKPALSIMHMCNPNPVHQTNK